MKFVFDLKIKVWKNKNKKIMQTISSEKWKETLVTKFQTAEELRLQDEFCDIILQSADKVQVKAHKLILSTGSNYFRDLFSSGMRESSSKCIEYKNIKGDILEKVISFIYTGKLEVQSTEKIEEVAVCGNYFQLEDLTQECGKLLSEFISDDNCLRYWRLAHECFQKEFEDKCVSYVLSSSELLSEPETFINKLDKEELETLVKDARLKWSEELKFEKVLKWCEHKTSSDEEFTRNILSLFEFIDFSCLSEKFILSNILENDCLALNSNVRKKLNEFLSKKTAFAINSHPNQNLVAIIGNELKTISNDGNFDNLQQRGDSFCGAGFTTFNEFLFVCGGTYTSARSEIFKSSTKEWRKLPSMKTSRAWHACTQLENRIYACGGINITARVSNVEIFDIGSEKWIKGPNMKGERSSFGLVSANRSIYAIGGCGTTNIQMLDLRSWDGWVQIHDGFGINDYTKCVCINNDIYCFRTDNITQIFDIRAIAMRDWNYVKNYDSKSKNNGFAVCALDEQFCFIEENYNDRSFIDFYKYNLAGNLIYSKAKVCQYKSYKTLSGLVNLSL